MSDRDQKPASSDRRSSPRHVTVEVHEADCEPIDIDTWVQRYVRAVLELDGVVPVAAPSDPPLQ